MMMTIMTMMMTIIKMMMISDDDDEGDGGHEGNDQDHDDCHHHHHHHHHHQEPDAYRDVDDSEPSNYLEDPPKEACCVGPRIARLDLDECGGLQCSPEPTIRNKSGKPEPALLLPVQ